MKQFLKITEITGVITGLLFTFLLQEGYEISWLFAIISAGIYVYLCFVRRIYAESLLQVFYIFTGVYGWMQWNESGGALGITLSWNTHILIILSSLGMVLISGYLLRTLTDAASPFIDSFTTVFSVFATLLMINLIPEHWIYWIVIDAVSVYLYIKRKLYYTALLFLLYTALAVRGALEWM